MRSLTLGLLAAPLLAPFSTAPLHAAPENRPNIVILYADDLGYAEISANGAPAIRTPAIDSIARRGVRFTQFYANAPECSPSRTALLTGRYQQRVGGLECAIGNGNVGRYDEAVWLQERHELGLPATETTLPRSLRDAGYATAIFGKWHLGYEPKFRPEHHGFAESFVTLGGGNDYFTYQEPDGETYLFENGRPATASGYLTDVFADKAIAWLRRQPAEKPYFLFLPFTAPHTPTQGPDDGPLPLPWPKGTFATYRAMIEHLDKRIGDILAAVAASPAADNTIVVFLSDNGAAGPGSNLPLRGWKSSMWEGGIRVPCVLSWPKVVPAGRVTDQVALNMDLTATLLAAAGVGPSAGHALDGVDLREVLAGKSEPVERTVFFRYKRGTRRNWAVRSGDLKFVNHTGEKALFDLAADPYETTDLLAQMPDRAAALEAQLLAWEREVAAPRLRDFKPVQN